MSSTNAWYKRSVLDELSTLGIYAEVPTLPEEEEMYDVDKTMIPSAADIAIPTIVWTAAPSIFPFRPLFIIAKVGSRQPLVFPQFNHFYYIKGWFEAAPSLSNSSICGN